MDILPSINLSIRPQKRFRERFFNKILKIKSYLLTTQRGRYITGAAFDLLLIILILSQAFQLTPQELISPLTSARFGFLFASHITSDNTVTLPNGATIPVAHLQKLFTEDFRNKEYIINKSHDFMALAPDLEERKIQELQLFKYLSDHNASASDIILALQATATRPARAWGMEELWHMRQNGELIKFNMYPLSKMNVEWALRHKIDPRILGIAIDTYGATLKLIEARPELFFEAAIHTKAKDNDFSKYLPNPAVVANLQMSETSWDIHGVLSEMREVGMQWGFPVSIHEDRRAFVNIGGVSAWDALNLSEEWFPSGQEDLIWIARELQHSSDLPYRQNVTTIPGSIRTSGDGSGGAIGPQFMPINARLFMTWYKEANSALGNIFPEPNLFNPWTGMIMTSLYLTSEFYHRQADINNITSVVRPGYALLTTADSEVAFTRQDPRMRALLKWNPLLWEAELAVEAGEAYNTLWRTHDLYAFMDADKSLN